MIARLDGPFEDVPAHPEARPNTSALLPLNEYDHIIVMFSGGKDSLASVLEVRRKMREQGVSESRLELWHQLVDGAPEEAGLMDWPVTHAYCVEAARALGLPLRFQWREGGFEREMLRENSTTAPVTIEMVDGSRRTLPSGRGEPSTRRLFPQPSKDLRVRWCSAYLKIDVGARALANDPRFQGKCKVLVVTGERREEGGKGGARARYATVEKHRSSNLSRRVDQWRPVLAWPEARVWAAIRAEGLAPHPCYFAGYGRASCAWCIFGQADEWATARALSPEHFGRLADYEVAFGKTIHRSKSVVNLADQGEPLAPAEVLAAWSRVLLSRAYDRPIHVPPHRWELPLGAFRNSAGPT